MAITDWYDIYIKIPLENNDSWLGGYFEASIRLGERTHTGADSKLALALKSIWEHELLSESYSNRSKGQASITSVSEAGFSNLYGWINFQEDWYLVNTNIVREEMSEVNYDWLNISLPLGGLSEMNEHVQAYPYGSPEDSNEIWMKPLCALLGTIAKKVISEVGGNAVIGFEVSGLDERLDRPPAAKRWLGLVFTDSSGKAEYYPPTEWSGTGITT